MTKRRFLWSSNWSSEKIQEHNQSPRWPAALSCFLLVLIDSVCLHVSTCPPHAEICCCQEGGAGDSGGGRMTGSWGLSQVCGRWGVRLGGAGVRQLSWRLTCSRSGHDRRDGRVSAAPLGCRVCHGRWYGSHVLWADWRIIYFLSSVKQKRVKGVLSKRPPYGGGALSPECQLPQQFMEETANPSSLILHLHRNLQLKVRTVTRLFRASKVSNVMLDCSSVWGGPLMGGRGQVGSKGPFRPVSPVWSTKHLQHLISSVNIHTAGLILSILSSIRYRPTVWTSEPIIISITVSICAQYSSDTG